MKITLILIIFYTLEIQAWHPCKLNDGSWSQILKDNVSVSAECMYVSAPLEWENFNPMTFNGTYYNQTKSIRLTELHMKRLFLTDMSPSNVSFSQHIINYWLVNGGGGSQYGMEPFGMSILKRIVANNFHQTYPRTYPIIYLFQYRGAGLSKPTIHCYNATNWLECADEMILTTNASSVNESVRIINAITNQNIARDLQYQVQYSMNHSQSIVPTSTYIYGLSQGTGIIEYYLSIQSIDKYIQTINGVVLDAVMSIENSDTSLNQIKSTNDRFYLYLSKCQADRLCSKAFSLVVGTDQDVLSVAYTLKMLFSTNMTDPRCTQNLGLTAWEVFTMIANEAIEQFFARPLAAILIARLYRCSEEDQQVLSRLVPRLIYFVQSSATRPLVDPPDAFPNDGDVLGIVTIWSDFVGLNLNESMKTNDDFFNDFCVTTEVLSDNNLAPTGYFPLCTATKVSKYNYKLSENFKKILSTRNSRYWGKLHVSSSIFRSTSDGVLLMNGDLDFNSPMYSAQQVQRRLESQGIRTKLVEMKGLTHVTSVQSFTKSAEYKSSTCTDEIIAQLLYGRELNLTLSTINYNCSLKENLIGIDWLYSSPNVEQGLNTLFSNYTNDYWGIHMTKEQLEHMMAHNTNLSSRLHDSMLFILAALVLNIYVI